MIVGGSALAACARQSEASTLETTTVRIAYPVECDPGLVLAKGYLQDEGFTDVEFVATPFTSRGWITENKADFACAHSEFTVGAIADGLPLRVLSGLHSGCLELWVRDGITDIHDLSGKRISVRVKDIRDMFYAWFAILLGDIGIALKNVDFVEAADPGDYNGMIGAFTGGRADAVLAGGPEGPHLRRRPKPPGHVLLETNTQTPWSQYFCCNLVANRDWAQQNPVATKRVTRALLRATDAAASDHASAARNAVAVIAARSSQIGGQAAGGAFEDESIVTETMAMCTYNWRELDPEDTLRFFALKLANVNLITSTPQQIIARGSDFAYMRQWKGESKS